MAFLRYRWGMVSALLFVCALAYYAVRAEERAEAPALKDVEPTAAQGCSLTIESQVGGKTVSDTRHSRLVALYVPAGSPPTPFLPAGPFKAQFGTDLAMRLRDDVTFSVVGTGQVKVLVNGAAVVEGEMNANGPLTGKTASLKKGKNRIVLEYASPAKGDSFVRLYWASSDFLPEPVPPGVLSYDAAATDVREGMRVRDGRTLFATLHCGKCHDDAASAQEGRMPELEADAPSLADVGGRLNEGWMAHWISDPRPMRHNATMPRMFRAAEGKVAAEAKDIAAYLATLGKADHPRDEDPAAEAVETGGRMFAHLRCIACHTLSEHADEESVKGRTPLHYVKAKYKRGALVAFLKAPEKQYAWIRMPDFRLSDKEAESLAAFLLSREQKEIGPDGVKGDAARGKELVTSAGCLNCHSMQDGVKSSLNAVKIAGIPKDAWTRGCLAEDESSRGKAPDFGLAPDQRQAILSFAATDRSSLQRDALAEVAERQVRALNCVACHPRDDQEDLYAEFQRETEELATSVVEEGEEVDGERISPDQTTPMLTWAGEKLRPPWMEAFIAGKVGYELRPWLRARMPGFPTRAKLIARGLTTQHGFSPVEEKHGEPDLEMAKNGMKLVGSAGGFQCVACHGVGEMQATSVFEAPAPNFKYSEQRLRKHFYDRWVIAPMRIHKETKMPAFADQEGKTSITDIYDGDARKQYDAIWHYLLSGEKIRPPEN